MRPIVDIKNDLGGRLKTALTLAKTGGELSFDTIPDFVVEIPREQAHGDFAANIALVMAKEARMAPRKIAEIILNRLDTADSFIDRAEVAGAGFINFFLKKNWLFSVPPLVHEMGDRYGSVTVGSGKKVQVEFVSANPTGLLHMGNARGGAIGDALAKLLSFADYDVEKEFYINDTGNQIRLLGASLDARFRELLGEDAVFPEDGYHGEDVKATAAHYLAEKGDALRAEDEGKRQEILADYALEEKLADMKRVLALYGVEFDVWFSERSLHSSGKVKAAMDELKERGIAYEKEGALLLKAEHSGEEKQSKAGERVNLEEKDEVLIRANGVPTYFAADIAYHKDKFDRGFDQVIDIWGADHHGHVARMKRAISFFGYDPDQLTVILMQLVKLYQSGELVRMSKRSGQYVTLEDLIEEVGYDAARYFFVMRNPDSAMDFDLDLAKSKSADNPVFYVQYAHARICSILRQTQVKGYALPNFKTVDYSVLGEAQEGALMKKLADLPEEIATAAETLEPHRLCVYLHDLASSFHSFYNHCHVNTEEESLRNARLGLSRATAIAIKNVLAILGVNAPTEM
ncbi:MAG TPA: arginine--tRNA ligase [Clostridiales bacterium]|nr:arginine--tRNA ligase [Clostridiales bacterium]